MDKSHWYQTFWSQFGWPAFDEATVPRELNGQQVEPPYITYMTMEDELEHPVYPNASLWDYGTSWTRISQKAKEIAETIGLGGQVFKLDSGRVWVQRGHPFAQRMSDENDMIRRIVINIEVEFLTAE